MSKEEERMLLLQFLESIMEYEHESHNKIVDNDCSNEEIVDTFLKGKDK